MLTKLTSLEKLGDFRLRIQFSNGNGGIQ